MVRDQKKVPCGYLWKKTDSQGKDYFAGTISVGIFGEIPIVVFFEEAKSHEKAADLVIRLATENREAK